MADLYSLGEEPQRCRVVAYQAVPLVGTAKGEKDDLYITPQKVVVLGLGAEAGAVGGVATADGKNSEFLVDETYGPNVQPLDVAQSVVPQLTRSAARGANGLLFVLGESGSGKTELMHGTGTAPDFASASAAGPSSVKWEGLVERAIDEIFEEITTYEAANQQAAHVVRMQFLNIVEERVQDLLQPNCHAHDLSLVERADVGTEVPGAYQVELSSKAQGLRLYRTARDELQRLERYHGVNRAASCCMLTISIVRRGMPRAAGAVLGSGLLAQFSDLVFGAAGAAGVAGSEGAMQSALTIVELPGTERLAEPRDQLHVSESPFLHRSLLQFSDLVHALASRSTAEHVPWRGGKLTSLLHGKLGVNALTLSVATVRCGQPKCSAATLALASRMRDVLCYPVLNTAAAQGLLTISRSEILALKEDLSQMVAKGIETLSPSRPPSEAGRGQPPRKKLDLVDTLQNPIKMATPRGTQPAQPATKATPPKEEEEQQQGVSEDEDEDEDEDFDGDLEAENAYLKSKLAKYKSRMAAAVSKPTPPLDPLVQSNLQGKLIQAELQAEQLRAARAAAVKERVELQKEYARLLGEMASLMASLMTSLMSSLMASLMSPPDGLPDCMQVHAPAGRETRGRAPPPRRGARAS